MADLNNRILQAQGELTKESPSDYQAVAASQTDKVLVGDGAGALGDRIDSLVITVATAATSAASIKDGSGSAIPITAANTPIGVYNVILRARSKSGAWSVTTDAGVSVLATGLFT